MDWKRFYAQELDSPPGRAATANALARHPRGDPMIRAALREGGIASFPHVSLNDSADPIARVVQSILESGASRVVALGVLHGGSLPMAYRQDHAALQGPRPQADEAFRRIGGAFVPRGAVFTPFGPIDEGRMPARGEFIREDAAILGGEFSLDLFLALLAAAARARGVRPPPVARVFVSATRSPDGSFRVADAIAEAIAKVVDAQTVCVATGDLAHLGHGYSPVADLAAIPADALALQAALLAQIGAMHAAALERSDFAAAWALGTRLLSDQRHMLPVIVGLVGPGATAEMLSFSLADYSRINGVPPPCHVAAALSVFRPALRGGVGLPAGGRGVAQ